MAYNAALKGLMKYARGNKKAAEGTLRNTTPKPTSTVSKAEVAAASATAGAVAGVASERARQEKNKPPGVGKANKGFGKAMNNGN